jgi:hypothetical protein
VWRGERREAPLLGRSAAAPGLAGPAVLVEYSATTFVPPGWHVARADAGILVLEKGVEA